MLKDILAAIDGKVARLEQVKTLLRASSTVSPARMPGHPANVATAATPRIQKTRKRQKMSAEARERIRKAQIERWVALNATRANMNGAVAPLSKAKKPARNSCSIEWLALCLG